jgi:hypothetical protein
MRLTTALDWSTDRPCNQAVVRPVQRDGAVGLYLG